MHVAGFDGLAQGGARGEQAALPDHFVEIARAHALGERTQCIAIHAQQILVVETGLAYGQMLGRLVRMPRR
jgi:hypothetical protein